MLHYACALLLSVHWASAVFFHEQSAVDFQVLRDDKTTSAYGFSLGYQKDYAKLVIGAPRYDNEGKVFQCSVPKIKDASCQDPVDINFQRLGVEYDRTSSPEQYFYLGASIATVKNGFVVCAPLRTLGQNTTVEKDTAFGICFLYHNGTAEVWNLASDYTLVAGGAGWATLSDEKQDRIIVSQLFKTHTAVFADRSNVENFTKVDYSASEGTMIYGQAISFGNYFDQNDTCYVFSLSTLHNVSVDFICQNSSNLESLGSHAYRLTDPNVGSMFGTALLSADVTRDGLDELLVGAPARVSDANNFDIGAVYVYTKSNDKDNIDYKMKLYVTIWGVANGARFGSTLSTNDVNGDSYPEIIISAPYEKTKDGEIRGVLYIICGYALYQNKRTAIAVTQLPRTQIIESSQSFGFSLQPVGDYNDNGSDELAVGSPENSTVTMFQGVPAVVANVTSDFTNDATDTNTEFSFSSCVTIRKPQKPEVITTRLRLENVLTGEDAKFKDGENATYVISLDTPTNITGDLYHYCKTLTINSSLSCRVNTTVSLAEDIEKEPEFHNTWVTLSAQSRLTKETVPQCNCVGVQCSPDYSLDLRWAGSSGRNLVYVVGSSDQETVSIIVRNSGTMGCGACANVRVSGLLPTLPLLCRPDEGVYMCDLPTPFRAGTNKTIDVQLQTNTLSNLDRSLTIDVAVHKECTKPEAVKSSLTMIYDFSKVLENVLTNGSTINRTISEAELVDADEDKLSVEQTFTIFNNQLFKWNNVSVTIDTDNKPYIHIYTVRMRQSTKSCIVTTDSNHRQWTCSINLASNSSNEITVAATIVKKEVASSLQSGSVKIQSKLKLKLLSDGIDKEESVLTLITLEHEQKPRSPVVTIIIAILVALLVLLLIVFILYKRNFFKRKDKEELEELKKEAKNRSLRSASVAQESLPAEAVPDPEPDHDFDMVDLIVDETPLKGALSSEQLNSIAAYSESGKSENTPKK